MRGHVLIVEDDCSLRELLETSLEKAGFTVTAKAGGEEAFELVGRRDFDVVVTDLNMRGMNGLELCERISSNKPHLPVIVITAFGSLDAAISAIRAGAHDFITKPFEIEALEITLDRAIRYRALQEEVRRLKVELAQTKPFHELIGESPLMRRVYEMIDAVAASDASVLITGETGTGKELVARAIHEASRRSAGAFVAINCASMPEALLDSELFGHTRGAFTDARAERAGLFVRSSGGTLFLDEIGDMPQVLQPKLLRALQERRVRPVGSDVEVPFDAHVIVATHRDLEAAVKDGHFREDLYFRINVIHIELPPLRSRGNDILLLAQYFIGQFASRLDKQVLRLSSPAAAKLLAYSWPGNIRELANSIERAVSLTRYEEITVEDLPEKIRSYSHARLPLISDDPNELLPMEEVEKRYIRRVLEAVGGSKTAAAQILGLDRKTLYRKLERYEEEGKEPQGT